MSKYIHTALKGTLTAIMLMVGISAWAQEPESKVAKIDETEYATLQDAINAVTESPTTITLLADITVEKEATVTVSSGKDISLTIGSYSISSPIANSGTLDFSNGTVSGNITNSGTLAFSDGTVSGNITNNENATITITGGTFTGTITNTNGTITISGGTFSTVDENFGNYLQSGYAVKANSGEHATYSVVAQTKTEVNESITGDAKTAADALAANTSTTTTEGLAYNQSLEISIEGVTLDSETSVVKTATFNVTPKDVNGNTIENASISVPITFRLPISAAIDAGKWVNLKHKGTPIPASQVAPDGDNRYVEITTTSFSPFEYQVLLTDPVAQIGKTKYETMAEAIDAAPAEETTIEILANITTAFEVTSGKNIALNIGTHTLSGNITNNGTLSISDGTITGNISNSGTISITGGTFTNEPEAEWIADGYEVMVGAEGKFIVNVEGTAEAKISEVKYQTIADAINAVSTEAEAEATTIVVLKDIETSFEISAEKKIALSVTTNTIAGDIVNAGTLAISDGTISGAITNAEGATMTISGGTFTGEITNSGTLTISGGTFTNKPSSYTCGEGKDLIINAEGVYVVTDVTLAEAEIDGNKYLTIGDAITAAGGTATTITLLKNPVAETITIPATADITLQINNVASTFDALTKPINVEGKLAITSGTISETTTLTITDFNAALKITAGVTHPAVALSTALQTENVLKSKAEGEPAVTTYWAEKKFEATVALTEAPTTEQTAAANALIANTSIKEVTGHATNQSLTITVTSVTLGTNSKVTKATFNVKLIGTDGEEVTGTVDPAVTFRLPVSDELNGQWANLWHDETAISGMEVVGATNGYVSVTTTSFSPFSYEIIETPIAQIGETKYASVADAIAAAPTSPAEATEIILVGTETDVTEAITVTENKNVKLTIGTHTIIDDITNAGTLTIADGTIEGTDKTITNTGALTISGGTISNPVTASDGTLTIAGGTLGAAITTNSTAGLIITNGAINGTLSVGGSGTNTISGGTISGAVTTSAATTISGGEITSNITNSAALTITDGIFTGTITNTGTVAISGGTHTTLPVPGFCATGYMPVKNEAGKYNMTNHWTITDATVIDGSHFEHLTSSAGYKVATATYNRNTGMVSAGNTDTQYGTICLPFAITAEPSGMTLYKATSIDETTLTITAVEYPVSAGTPLIFALSAAASSMTVESTLPAGVAVNTDNTNLADDTYLHGTYTAQDITSGLTNIYYLNGDKFHKALSKLTVPAFRAYMVTSGGSVKEFTLTISKDDNEATGIQQTTALEGVTEVYDLDGRKLSGLQRGVNIMRRADGSTIKVIVK